MGASGIGFLTSLAVRTAIILLVLVIGIRLFGKREMGGMNIYDLVLVMALANGVQNAMTKGSGLLAAGLVTSGTLILLGWIVARIVTGRPSIEARLVGTPTILVQDGQLVRPNLRREGVTEEEIRTAVRGYGLDDLDKVKLAVLELDGSLSVVQKE